jgi:hypothetical protein
VEVEYDAVMDTVEIPAEFVDAAIGAVPLMAVM